MTPVHPQLQEIVDDFAAVSDKDRLQLLLEYSQDLPALPERYAEHRELLEPVPECQTPLFLAVETGPDSVVHLFFEAPAEAPTTRGFAAILHAGLDGLPAEPSSPVSTAIEVIHVSGVVYSHTWRCRPA